MGLRLFSSYFDYNEAVIVRSTLAHAGIFAVIANEDLLRVAPYYTLALGGFRVLISDDDLDDAVSVVNEALANPIPDAEVLVIRGSFVDRLASVMWGWLSGGAPTPIREYSWRSPQ